jgi:hypothetical protein
MQDTHIHIYAYGMMFLQYAPCKSQGGLPDPSNAPLRCFPTATCHGQEIQSLRGRGRGHGAHGQQKAKTNKNQAG